MSVIFHVWPKTYLCIDGLAYDLVQLLCSDLDPDPYLKGHSHMIHLKLRLQCLRRGYKLHMYALMDYHV